MIHSPVLAVKEIANIFRMLVDDNVKFVLTTHVNPDADGLGSELALHRFLKKLRKSSAILNHSETPANHAFMDYDNEIKKFDPEKDGKLVLGADVLVAVDMNNPSRLRSMEKSFLESKARKVIIDHHLEAQDFVDYQLIDLDSPATAEIVYKCLMAYDPNLLDKGIAEALYAAIMTDTGSFRFPRTDGDIHRVTAHLLDVGVDPNYIYNNLYEQNSIGRTRLLGEVLQNVQLAYEGKVAYFSITQEQLKKNRVVPDETEQFANYAGAISGVVVSIFFMELPDGIKISFRSKGDVSVNELAKLYGGGGHKNAAGARLFGAHLDEIIPRVLKDASRILPSKNISEEK
ncbi:MAG TPA: bifunctional oligoribonuclease/PAP phosphatase NrnA [Candidatus Acidoferrales bacterium]|nr:bifunctional oligoribonuclease/PAP phosphatase NrnA [Candidatus Acidoferrales bacterium]